MTRTISLIALSSLAAFSLAFAQDSQDQAPPADQPQQQSPAPNGGWRRATDPPPAQPSESAQTTQPAQPTFSQRPNYAAYPNYSQSPQGQPSDRPPEPPPVPAQLTIKAGTYVTVRVNQPLSSDHNHPGDGFTASLVRPIVVDGVVVAQRGQTLGGVVKETQKAGRVEGVSRLGIQLTDVTLVDGQQLPIQSQLITWKGETSVGRDAVGVGATTATGAAIGAAVNGGVGAGVGAGAGLIVGAIGVLLTRGHATVITPESILTFRVEAPVTVSTERAPYAFRYVSPNDYERPYDNGGPQAGYRPPPPAPYYGYGYGYGYPYYPYYPYYWGSGFGIGFYPGFYGGFYGRGFYGGGFRGGFHGRR